MNVLALALDHKVLALALREKSWPRPCQGRGQDFPTPQDSGHVVAVPVCCAHTHSVTWLSAISCLGMLPRLVCKLDVGYKIIRVCEANAYSSLTFSSFSQRYNCLYSLSLCLELTNSVSVRLLCNQSPLGLLDLVTQHTFRNPCVSSFSCLVSSDIMKLPLAYHFQGGGVA